MQKFRIEHDFLGEKEIPDEAYYGVQTVRALQSFYIIGIPISKEPLFIQAFGYVKKAAAMANRDVLAPEITDAICQASDKLIAESILICS